MTTINLKDFYYWYLTDVLVEMPDEVAEELIASKRREAAHAERVRYNKAYYSLDCDDGIEYSACLHEPSPQELMDRKELFFRLWNALNSLPEIQGRRVDAHLILGKSYRQIAREEGVDKSAVRCSVKCGIYSNLSDPDLNRSSIAEYLHMSPDYLSYVFHQKFNQTLSAYITSMRIDKAKELLERTNWGMDIIAEKTGFSSSSYFHKQFKKITGITPQQYRSE